MSQHAGYYGGVNLTISLCLTYMICISGVRLWIRKGAYGVDDLIVSIATFVVFAHSAADYAALANGLGLPWTKILREDNVHSLSEASIAGVVTFTIALYLSKCAMVAFLGRITKTHSRILFYQGVNGALAAIGFISILVVTVDCTPGSGYYWAIYDNRFAGCPTQSIRWQALTALDIITEVLLLVLPIHLVWGLQMPRSKKAMIIAAFYLRIPVIGFSISRNYYTLQLRLPSADAGLDSGIVVIWLEIQLAYALAASTLSASKAFTESFNSGFGLGFARGKGEDSYGLSDISGKSPNTSKDEKSRTDSAWDSGAESSSRMQSPPPATDKIADLLDYGPATPREDLSTDRPLKFRPEMGLKAYTNVSTQPHLGPYHECSAMTASKNSSADDMVIVRETGFDVQHDRAPILLRS